VEVRVFLPDLKGRTEILDLYMKKIKADKSKTFFEVIIGFLVLQIKNCFSQKRCNNDLKC